jgi:hypothetical protein
MQLIARYRTASFVLSLMVGCAGIAVGPGCGESGTTTAPTPKDTPSGPSQLEKDFQKNIGASSKSK